MRRALLVAAVVTPLAVLAAVSAGSGQLLEVDNYNATGLTSYVNAAQCTGTETTNPLNLEWNIQTAAGFTGGGTYRLFASTVQPSQATGTTGIYCAETSAPNATPAVTAGQVGQPVTADKVLMDVPFGGTDVMAAVAKTCDSSAEGQQIWVCAHWYDLSSNKNGWASGKFTIQLASPAVPTGVTVGWGDSKLVVDWTRSAGSPAADHYVAQATPVLGGPTITSDRTTGTSVTIKGLTNGTEYAVVVVAYSVGGNPSSPSAEARGTPALTADFWKTYESRGGADQGGCASGGAGALSLLATASLLALRRRKP